MRIPLQDDEFKKLCLLFQTQLGFDAFLMYGVTPGGQEIKIATAIEGDAEIVRIRMGFIANDLRILADQLDGVARDPDALNKNMVEPGVSTGPWVQTTSKNVS